MDGPLNPKRVHKETNEFYADEARGEEVGEVAENGHSPHFFVSALDIPTPVHDLTLKFSFLQEDCDVTSNRQGRSSFVSAWAFLIGHSNVALNAVKMF